MDDIKNYKNQYVKMEEFYHILVKWVTIYQQGRNIGDYFKRKGYKKVAIYGMREMGMLLYDELVRNGIYVSYIIDQNADFMNLDIDVDMYTPKDDLPQTEIIVVTAVHYLDIIKECLAGKVSCPIVSLQDVIADS